MTRLYVIAGATATGKTAAAVALAQRVGGEVVSADSMQVYRGMDIGTATPTAEEMCGVPHHLINILAPDEGFSAAEFKLRAAAAVDGIRRRGKVPIICGGTGFYINALLYDAEFSEENERENELRQIYENEARELGAEFVYGKLKEVDPVYAASLHANNVKRVARALAFCTVSGGLFSVHNSEQAAKKAAFSQEGVVFAVLQFPRNTLYERINARAVAMFEAGLVEETRNLLAAGYDKKLASMQVIGYKESVQIIEGGSRSDAVAAVQQSTRRYAKRQVTWFNNQVPHALYLDADGKTPRQLAAEIER